MISLLILLGACQSAEKPSDPTFSETTARTSMSTGSYPASLGITSSFSSSVITTVKEALAPDTQNKHTTLLYPEELTPVIRKNRDTILSHLSDFNYLKDYKVSDAERLAKRFYVLGIPEIVDINIVNDPVLDRANYNNPYGFKLQRIQFIDINMMSYYIIMNESGGYTDIVKGEGDEREILR